MRASHTAQHKERRSTHIVDQWRIKAGVGVGGGDAVFTACLMLRVLSIDRERMC
jgi:hypothetical protein